MEKSHGEEYIVIILFDETTGEIHDYYHDMKSMPSNHEREKYSIDSMYLRDVYSEIK